MYFPNLNFEDFGDQGQNTSRRPGQLKKRMVYEVLSEFARQHGFTVTSTNKGRHNKGSAHYEGRAIDVRTHRDNKPLYTDQEIRDFMRAARDQGYVILDERNRPKGQKVWSGPHLHIQTPRQPRRP